MTDRTFDQLWKHFVPRDGAPRTEQGHALRAIARISDGVTIDDGANWGDEHDSVLTKLTGYLTATPLLDPTARAAVAKDLALVAARERHAAADTRAALARIRASVIEFCNARLRVPES